MYYYFIRIHSSLLCTPAMAAGVSKTLWSVEDNCLAFGLVI